MSPRRAVALLSVVALGAALRAYQLGAESYWTDELITLDVADDGIQQILTRRRPPVVPVIMHYWIAAFGDAEAATRLLSTIAGTTAIALTYAVGARLFGATTALVAALLIAVSQFQIAHSQEIRYYAVLLATACLSFLLYVELLRRGTWMAAVVYGLATALFLETHVFAAFAVAAQGLDFLLGGRRRIAAQRFAYAAAIVAVIAGWRLAIFAAGSITGGASVPGWIPAPDPATPFATLAVFLGAGPLRPPWIAVIAAAGVALAGAWWHRRRRTTGHARRPVPVIAEGALRLTVLWATLPIVLPFALSFLLSPMYQHKYAIAASPAVCLLAGLAIVRARRVVPVGVSVAAILAFAAPTLARYYDEPVHEPWREAFRYVDEDWQAGDGLLVAGSHDAALRRYASPRTRGCAVAERLRLDEIAVRVRDCFPPRQRLWVVFRDSADPQSVLRSFFLAPAPPGFTPVRRKALRGIDLHLFARTKTSDDP